MVRGGLHVFADQDYESRIRGGHNFFRVRISDEPLLAQREQLDILIALNKETVELHRNEVKETGLIIGDESVLKLESVDSRFMGLPLENLALQTAGNKIMSNSVAVGAVCGLLDYDFQILDAVLRWHFSKSPQKIQEDNVNAARAGFEYGKIHRPSNFNLKCSPSRTGRRMFLTGHEAVSLGAIAAGCQFLAAYPMTPTTPILELLAEKGRNYDIAVIQAEDEISAINMVVGASFAGVRAMTATSGSGFALMVEGIGLAGITETPTVIVLGQRPGPAVGLPTRTEQGELLMAIRVGTGEFPRAILTPATVEDAFFLTAKAFNLAEKYQVPVIILTDTHLANSYNDVEKFDTGSITIDRGELLSGEASEIVSDYRRHLITESGISPRALPGMSTALVVTDSDEHDEYGHLTESAVIRTEQVKKRLRKYEGLKSEVEKPRIQIKPNAELTLIGWGSTFGAIQEASKELEKAGVACNVLHFIQVWPFPSAEVIPVLNQKGKKVVVESNATGQLAYLIRAETGQKIDYQINKWDGRPISPQYIVNELK
ncbi:MAG: 2-oxoacid:acceptor oxidoreductase subunit alpha, partial [Dehalococcoidales bacterium]|nr:2-oxoacid:acceptor oxidoreductase subunit alpha [Dehalococcoidales bacterium]